MLINEIHKAMVEARGHRVLARARVYTFSAPGNLVQPIPATAARTGNGTVDVLDPHRRPRIE